MSESIEFSRLPKNVVPAHYSIEIKPNLEEFVFVGKVAIKVQIKDAVEKIHLHALDLKIKSATLDEGDGILMIPKDIKLDTDEETLTLSFEKSLKVGEGKLVIEFSGEINDNMKGFYRSKYTTASGEDRYAAVTQFCPTDTRRCFPCWDEPAIKATFDVTLIVPEDRKALSNMPEKSRSKSSDGLQEVQFETSPIMSTYLVAFVVGEYDYVEGISADEVLVRVYTPIGKKAQGEFALDVAKKALPFYKNYFGIAYPLPKIDLIAIADFPAGAMENWGLVTYREKCLLVDLENTALLQKQAIALTVTHEIAHQWFGNLVTMEWWTHIWLNEGYASFVEFLCVDHIFPDYDIWTQFATDVYTCALDLDALQNSHPIEIDINHPSEVNEIFDAISYKKGASIIRMLHNYIGDDCFRKGMNTYLTRHQYKNASTEDLWAALEEASKKPIGEIMSTWTKQMGFPVLNVRSKQNGSQRVLTLSQSKFSVGSVIVKENYFWMITVAVSTAQAPNEIAQTYLMDKETMDIVLDNISETDWIKVNPGNVGYFRTKYSPDILQGFIPAIKDQSLPALDRLSLLDDLFAMVQAGKSSSDEVLSFIDAYRNETNYTVWSSISYCMAKLQMLFATTDIADRFDEFAIRLFTPISEQLGWTTKAKESHMDALLRGLILNRLVSFNCTKTIAEAKKRFDQHIQGTTLLPADLRTSCYKAALKEGNATTFENMKTLYRATDLNEERDRLSQALGSSKDINILRKVIDFALSDEVRNQDSVYVLIAVALNPIGRNLVWEYFKDNFQVFSEQYKSLFLITRLIKYITENFTSEERALEVESFFKEHDFPGTERTVSQSIETIRLNAAWLQRDLDPIRNYFLKM